MITKHYSYLSLGMLAATCMLWICAPIMASASFENVLERMYDNNLTKYADVPSYRPYDQITRGEAAKLLSQYAGVQGLSANWTDSCYFRDTAGYDDTLLPFIDEVCEYGLMKGAQERFRPYDQVSYAEGIAIVMRSLLGRQDETGALWRAWYAQSSEFLGIADEQDIKRYANQPVSRETLWTWLYNAARYTPKDAEERLLNSIMDDLINEIK